MDEFSNGGLMMDFWNENIVFVTQIEWKMWTQKVCHTNAKLKIKK